MLIFTKLELCLMLKLNTLMENFARVSELKINSIKSTVYAVGVHEDVEARILEAIRVPKGELPFRYLGFPLSSKWISIHHCQPIVDKITARVKHWSSRKLSMAGRVQLVNSTICGYWAQVFLLPRKIIHIIDRIWNECNWAIDKLKDSMPRIAWNHVCKPRSCGGLNIYNFLVWNDVALLKSLWALTSKKDRLWIKGVDAYSIKGADTMQIRVRSTVS